MQLFDGEHIKQSDKAVYNILKEAADEAFLGNSIFKVSLDIFRASVFTNNIPESLLARIRYLHVRAYLSSSEWQDEHLSFLTETWERVKACPWNLKACVLTLEVRTCENPSCWLATRTFAVSTVDQTTQFSAELLGKTNAGLDLGTILAAVFEDFADKLPASCCYVRIVQAHFDTTSAILTRSYGPLLAVQRAEHVGLDPISHGERMLDQAYRFARTSELRRQDRSGVWE